MTRTDWTFGNERQNAATSRQIEIDPPTPASTQRTLREGSAPLGNGPSRVLSAIFGAIVLVAVGASAMHVYDRAHEPMLVGTCGNAYPTPGPTR